MWDCHPRSDNHQRDDKRGDHREGSQIEPEAELRTVSQPGQSTPFPICPLERPLPRLEQAAHQQLALHQDSGFDAPDAVIDELARPGVTLSARPERFPKTLSGMCVGRHRRGHA
jgi:hypothetical protein